jgi:hypothetical protein
MLMNFLYTYMSIPYVWVAFGFTDYHFPKRLHIYYMDDFVSAGKDHLGKERAPLQGLKEGIVFDQRKLSTQTHFLTACAQTS